jgi:GNAT superfamily N-acetyltransferase
MIALTDGAMGLPTVDGTRAATAADVELLTEVLVRAFTDDPVYEWIFPEQARRIVGSRRMFRILIRQIMRNGAVLTDDACRGAALWRSPTARLSPVEDAVFAVRMAWILGRRVGEVGAGFAPLERNHPAEPHVYLPLLGTDPAHQGRGVGSALLAPALAWCDQQALPAYLESSKEGNIPFYRRHGFEVTEAITIKNGPTVWPMLRKPL